MNDYRIWFKVEGYDEIELPVNPQEVSITYPGNPSSYDVEGIGEIIIPRLTKLATVSFESFFPREKLYQTVINSESWHTPEWYVSFFRNIQKSRKPFELTIVRGGDVINEYDGNGKFTTSETHYFDTVFDKAVLLDITVSDHGGEPGDVYYNMSISEYRDASPKTLAELASEKTDSNGEVVSQEMVLCVNRPPQSGAIVVDTSVEVNGKVYEDNTSLDLEWECIRTKVNNAARIISRVLPPEYSFGLHSYYIQDLGWVDRNSLRISNQIGMANGLRRIITENYD